MAATIQETIANSEIQFHLRVASTIQDVLKESATGDPTKSYDIDFTEALSVIDEFFCLQCSFLFLRNPIHADRLNISGSTTLKLTPLANELVSRFDSPFLASASNTHPFRWFSLDRWRFDGDRLWGLLWETMELGPYAHGASVLAVPLGFDPREAGIGHSGFLVLVSRGNRKAFSLGEAKHLSLLVSQLSMAIEFGNSIRRTHDHLKEVTERLGAAGEATQLHNIFSPLQRVELNADLLHRAIRRSNPKDQKKYLDLIRKDAWEANRFTKGILDLRRRPAPPEFDDQVDLRLAATNIESHYQDYANAAGKTLVVRLVADDGCKIAISRGCFDSIIEKLLHNAMKYGFRGTKIKVKIRTHFREMICDVISYGIIINHKEKEQIFELGYRTRDAAKMEFNAVGLGLYWARRLAFDAGGQLFLVGSVYESTQGETQVFRNTFRLRIPVRR